MKNILFWIACAAAPSVAFATEEVRLNAADGVTVFGTFYPAAQQAKALILLFHQAGSNRGEYERIAPRLNEAGYSCLAIDQRSGGSRWGRSNQTAKALAHPADYLDAAQDLEAAVGWAKANHASDPIILWGSSYSSSLVFSIAARHPEDVKAVLSFSPGEYFKDQHAVRQAASQVSVPVFVTSAQDAEEIAAAKAILAAVPAEHKVQFVPSLGGVHGSSTLLAKENPQGYEAAWRAVLDFLASVHP